MQQLDTGQKKKKKKNQPASGKKKFQNFVAKIKSLIGNEIWKKILLVLT